MPSMTLESGEIVEYPEGWTTEQVMQALSKKQGASKAQPKEDDSNLLQKIMRYGVKDPLAGTSKMIRNVGSGLPDLSESFKDMPLDIYKNQPRKLRDMSDADIYQAYGLPPAEEQNPGDMFMQIAPDIAGAIAAPEVQLPKWLAKALGKAPGIAGKVLPKTVSQSATQALYGGAVSPEGQKGQGAMMSGLLTAPLAGASRAAQVTPSVPLRHALGVTGGSLGAGLGYETGQQMGLGTAGSGTLGAILGALGYRGISSSKAKEAAQYKGVDLTDPAVIERLEAADRLGVHITPAEATKSPYLAGEHAKLGRSSEGSKKYYEKAEERIAQEEASINKMLDTVFDIEKMPKEVREGYKKAYQEKVPPTMGLKYSKNKTVQNAIKSIENDPELMQKAKKLGIVSNQPTKTTTEKGAILDIYGKPITEKTKQSNYKQKLDQTKLGTWDFLKRYLDKHSKWTQSPDAPTVDKMKTDTFKDLSKSIVDDLDPLFPEYEKTRSLAERKIARDTIQKAFDKSDVGGKQIYKAFESKKKFDDLMHHLRDVPEAQRMLKDMKLIFEESKKKPTLATSAGLEATGMKQDRNFKNAIDTLINKIVGGERYDTEVLDAIYSGKWTERMKNINKITDTDKKVAAFIELMGDVSGSAGRRLGEDD